MIRIADYLRALLASPASRAFPGCHLAQDVPVVPPVPPCAVVDRPTTEDLRGLVRVALLSGAGTAPAALIACRSACYKAGLSQEAAGRLVLDMGAELKITGLGMAILTRRQEGEAPS